MQHFLSTTVPSTGPSWALGLGLETLGTNPSGPLAVAVWSPVLGFFNQRGAI